MLVDRISYGSAQFTFTDQDLNALALACSVASENLVSEEHAETSALVEAMGATFTAAWFAVKAQLGSPVDELAKALDNGEA